MLMEALDTPAVVIDRDRLEANIAGMAAFCRDTGVSLRPHVKAHKLPQIALKQLAAGAAGVTVARLKEAEVMAAAGIRDILIAYQVVGAAKIGRLLRLAAQARLAVAVDSAAGARLLARAARKCGQELSCLIEINSGLDRCGVPPGDAALELARELTRIPGLAFKGIFTHAGQVYGAASPDQVAAIGQREGEMIAATAALMRDAGLRVETVSAGSTPTARYAAAVKGVTEIRPGNYVFNDAIQVGLGVASPDQCALSVYATVISKPAPGRVVIDAGSKTFALDKGAHGSEVVSGYGIIADYPHLVLSRLSEEHGIITAPAGTARGGRVPALGEQLRIIPNHACVVVNLAETVLVAGGGRVVERWPVAAKGS